MFKKIIKNTSIISLGTFVSRIFGFIRDLLIAKFFGTSDILEAFLVAFRLPNIFRNIFAEGFTDSVLTPTLSEYHKDRNTLYKIVNKIFVLFSILSLVFVILGIIFSKYLVMLSAPGYISYVSKFNLAVSFTKITFIYLFLICISSIFTSTLYSLKKFFIPAINPVFLNISFIIGIIFFKNTFKNYTLVFCVIFAGILEVIFPYISLKKELFNLNIRGSIKKIKEIISDNIILKMVKLFIPRIWSSIIYHLSVFLDTILASLTGIVGKGALAGVYYANRVTQLPFALIALAIAPVVIVDFSIYYKEKNLDDFKKLLVFSFENIMFFIIPIASIFLFIPEAVIDVIFRRGEFDLYSLKITSSIFFFYSFGLFFFCAVKLLVSCFYSLKDTITPAKTATLSLIVNGILSIIFMFPLKAGGLALGTSISAAFNFFLLYFALKRKIGNIPLEDLKREFLKIIFLSIIIGVLSKILWTLFYFNRYLKILIVLSLDSFVFVILGYILKLRQLNYLKECFLKKK